MIRMNGMHQLMDQDVFTGLRGTEQQARVERQGASARATAPAAALVTHLHSAVGKTVTGGKTGGPLRQNLPPARHQPGPQTGRYALVILRCGTVRQIKDQFSRHLLQAQAAARTGSVLDLPFLVEGRQRDTLRAQAGQSRRALAPNRLLAFPGCLNPVLALAQQRRQAGPIKTHGHGHDQALHGVDPQAHMARPGVFAHVAIQAW